VLGRFISEDPIGFAAGPNVYSYNSDDPINFTDPTGLCGVACAAPALGAFGGPIGEAIGLTIATLATLYLAKQVGEGFGESVRDQAPPIPDTANRKPPDPCKDWHDKFREADEQYPKKPARQKTIT